MKLLTFTTLYPNEGAKHHGIFVEQRLRRLLETREMQSIVLAPVPWFPFDNKTFGKYAEYARVPKAEVRHNIRVTHPRYPVIPKIGMGVAPILMALPMISVIKNIIRSGYDFDVIDAHYVYPDGVVATMLGRLFGKPTIVTARGTDVNLLPKYAIPRMWIKWSSKYVKEYITVCKALKVKLMELGIGADRVTVLRNGVDLELFKPMDRKVARTRIGVNLEGDILISVGHLVEGKGHHIVIRAMKHLPDTRLMIIGGGEMKSKLEEMARDIGVASRVEFFGVQPQERLNLFYNAANALVLASSREGMANVLLESIACGTPVIATNVGGTPEVISDPSAGILLRERNPESIAMAFQDLTKNYPRRKALREYALQFGWDKTTQGQVTLFDRYRT
jgi:teichuronic acid biosynthesis glycosyltransferase TuaC